MRGHGFWLLLLLALISLGLLFTYVFVIVEERGNIVVEVIDGDTIRLSNGEVVRLLSIDAPERGEYYYDEAKNRLAELVKGRAVYLERDVSDRDRYGRLLRYVYVDGDFVNLKLVEEGFSRVSVQKPDVRYEEELLKAERLAKIVEIGIWTKEKGEDICCIALGCPKDTKYVGSKKSRKAHKCCSRWARVIAPENLICFRSKNEAILHGYEVGGE